MSSSLANIRYRYLFYPIFFLIIFFIWLRRVLPHTLFHIWPSSYLLLYDIIVTITASESNRKRRPAYLAPFLGSFFGFLFSVVGSIFYSTATSTYHFTNIAYLFYRTLSIKERSNQYRKRFHLMPVSSSCTHTGEENHSCRRHHNNSWISAVKYPGYKIRLLPPVWSGDCFIDMINVHRLVWFCIHCDQHQITAVPVSFSQAAYILIQSGELTIVKI